MASSERQRAALVAQLVVDEFRRAGFLPPELLRSIQAARASRSGDIIPLEQVEREARVYAERLCAELDAVTVTLRGDDSIDRAVDTLMTCTPTGKPAEWAESVAIVEQAWREGRLSPKQMAELDALDTVMAAKGN